MSENSAIKGTKHSIISVSTLLRMSMAPSTPMTMKQFFTKFTRIFVNIMEMAFVSFVTLVTSFPTGKVLSCSCDRDSMCVKTSSLMADMILCPVF